MPADVRPSTWGAGEGEQTLNADRLNRRLGIWKRARAWYEANYRETRAIIDGFAQGINDFAQAHAALLSEEARAVLPVSGVDILAHLQNVIHFHFVFQPDLVPAASNAWAISPARSRSGHSLLLINPHTPWSDLFTWYEAQLVVEPDGLDAYGATFVGFPFLAVGFNPFLGWAHTVNTMDGSDLYGIEPTVGGYVWDNTAGNLAFTEEEQTIRVREANGSFRDEHLVVRSTIHGPVIIEDAQMPIALRVSGLDQPFLVAQYLGHDAVEELRRVRGRGPSSSEPHVHGRLRGPRRAHHVTLRWPYPGQAGRRLEVLARNRSGELVGIPVDRDDLLCGTPEGGRPVDGMAAEHERSTMAYDAPLAARPRSLSGVHRAALLHLRAQQSIEMLLQNPAMELEDMVRLKHSTQVPLAGRVIAELVTAARARGGAILEAAARVLEAWDRTTDADSRGAVLFAAWVDLFPEEGGGFAEPWSEIDPLKTPRGLRDPEAASQALETIAVKILDAYTASADDPGTSLGLDRKYWPLAIRWGQVNRFRREDVDVPANGGGESLGVFRTIEFGAAEGAPPRAEALSGDSFVAAVEFSQPPRAYVLLGYGNASQPSSTHRTDQLEWMARKELRRAWLTRDEIEANLEQTERL